MKKILTLLLITTICFTLFGCKDKNSSEDAYKQYETLQEINDVANVLIVKPGVMGISDEKFYVIEGKVAAYGFNLNGYDYFIRGTKELSFDMSGIVNGSEPLFKSLDEKIQYGQTNEYKAYRFILGNIQYIFGVKDNGKIEKELFEGQSEEVFNALCYEATTQEIKNALGTYYDSYSQRAVLNISLTNINEILIDIVWSSSANETDEWLIQTIPQTHKVEYENIIHKKIISNEDETTTETLLDDYGSGYFEYENEILKWTGSGNENTSSCIFEKAK